MIQTKGVLKVPGAGALVVIDAALDVVELANTLANLGAELAVYEGHASRDLERCQTLAEYTLEFGNSSSDAALNDLLRGYIHLVESTRQAGRQRLIGFGEPADDRTLPNFSHTRRIDMKN